MQAFQCQWNGHLKKTKYYYDHQNVFSFQQFSLVDTAPILCGAGSIWRSLACPSYQSAAAMAASGFAAKHPAGRIYQSVSVVQLLLSAGQWCIGGYMRVYGVYQPPRFFWQRILTSVIINKQGTFRPFATPICINPPPFLAIHHWRRCLQHGVIAANVGSFTLTADIGGWTQAC